MKVLFSASDSGRECHRAVQRVLESRGGNKAEAARILGINRRTLYRMLGRSFGVQGRVAE